MELFFVGALVGIVATNIWGAFLRPLARRAPSSPPALPPPGEEIPQLPPARNKRRK